EVRAVLLDVKMPRLEGPAALAQIRQIAPQVRFCFMTGYATHHGADNLLALGAARVFDKPFRLEEVLETLRELCGRPRRLRPPRPASRLPRPPTLFRPAASAGKYVTPG